ncbi:MAG: PAS domain-containing protein [Planctomycetes bacterium]|nr:PAS domain-containing protein [Planctomycetota bacterium]
MAEVPASSPPRALNPLGWVPIALLAWLAVFGTYEIVERTLLKSASHDLLSVLHMIRGTGTSFLLASVVAWYILRRRVEPFSVPGGLRTIVAEAEAEELARQGRWIVGLRWVAVAGVVVTAVASRYLLDAITSTSALALLVIAGVMVGYNVLFARMPEKELSRRRSAFAQVLLDLAALTLMLHFAGGVANPFFLFYIFHIVIGGILLRKGETYFVTLATNVLFCGIVVLDRTGVAGSHPLNLGAWVPMPSQGNWRLIVGILAAFVATTWCTAYFTTAIMEKLRRRGAQIVEAGELLSQERAKMEDIVRSVGAGLLILDLEDRILWANDVAKTWFGPSLVHGACIRTLWGGETPCESCPRGTRQVGTTEERSVRIDGKQRFFLVTCTPIRVADGRIDQILMLVQDITPMKEIEIQLLQAGKMVAVGQLAAGIAHEINNPLAVVASSAEILGETIRSAEALPKEQAETIVRHLKKVEDNVFRCKGIIQNLLAFARREDEMVEQVDLAALLDDTVGLVAGSARARDREIVRAYSKNDGTSVRSQSRKIQQVVLNLVLNALDATEPGGRIRVSAERSNGGVEIGVADWGNGIPAEHLGRIFEPFFTTKPVGKGTGLGLYLCHQFVESLGGKISVQSRVGEGTQFKVWLPAGSG